MLAGIAAAAPVLKETARQPPVLDGLSFLVLLVGGTAIGLGLRLRHRVAGEAIAAGGAMAWAMAGYFHAGPHWGLTLPAFIVPWAALLLETEPETRAALIVLQYVGMVPFFESILPGIVPTNVVLALGAAHLLLVWATLPDRGRWRTAVLAVAAAACALLTAGAIVGWLRSPGWRGLVVVALMAAFLALLLALRRLPRLRAWRLRPHPWPA